MSCGAHKYVMHGWGWGWHRSHHEPNVATFEQNDLYAITFAGMVIVMFTIGIAWDVVWCPQICHAWLGLGLASLAP